MGQRHQIYVIARVRCEDETTGHRRCVAAYHHQWCYGRTALHLLSRFLRLISQPDNVQSIRREIANVQGNWGEEPAEVAVGREDYVPCPFIAFLLHLAWNVNLDDVPVYVAGTTFSNAVQDVRMDTSDGHNDDGITIIDVTDPSKPSYCFNQIGGPPLTAEQYVRQYYPQTIDLASVNDAQVQDNDTLTKAVATEHMVLQAISPLQDVPLMSIDSLVEAWPEDYYRARRKMLAAGTYVSGDPGSPDNPIPAVFTSYISSRRSPPAIPSLADISLRQAILYAVNEGDVESIQDSTSQPGQREIIFSTLRDISPLPQAGAELLAFAIGRDHPVDVLNLSGIDLTSSAVIGLVRAAGSALIKLDLTGNSRVTISDVVDILRVAPSIRQLIIFGCPLVSDEEIYGLLATSPKAIYTLEFIGHDAFFRRPYDGNPRCPYAPSFTCILGDSWMRKSITTSLPYFTPSRLLRCMYTLLKPFAAAYSAYTKIMLPPSDINSDPSLPDIALTTGHLLKSSTAVLHAAFAAWDTEAASVSDAVRLAQVQGPDPSGLRANTQRITLIPQTPASPEGWLLLLQPENTQTRPRFGIARKRVNQPPIDSEPATKGAHGIEVFTLTEFVKALVDEGRPAPPPEDVAALAGVIDATFPEEHGDRRFDSASAAAFLKRTQRPTW
ncbi:unnamed protein product [Peniophora sp. CBMAI 1063]|nr:unnamed protein product [Peniophora sp. CBMAI 1063]